MSRLRKIALAVLAVCLAVCAGVAIAACDKGGPGIINTKAAYTVTLVSQGGMPLRGVAVSLEKDGKAASEQVLTTKDGSAKLEVEGKGEYDIVIEVPEGYTIATGEKTKTSADEDSVTITFNSSIIKSPIPAGKVYKLGDVIHDFTFTDSATNVEYNLADTLADKKAVVLNFWGTDCGFCVAEFPAIQEAYEEYSDKIEIFALSSYLQSDTKDRIAKYKTDNGYTFPMGLDHGASTAQVYTHFNFGGYPTTVVIDRFGVVAHQTSGGDTSAASWKALFKTYTDDNYSNGGIQVGEDPADVSVPFTKRPEGTSHPTSDAVAAAINGNGLNRTMKYEFHDVYEDDWFWDVTTVDGRDVIRPNSYATDYTYAAFYCTVDLGPGDGLKYDYNVNTLADENILSVLINGKKVNEHVRSSGGWQTCTKADGRPLYVATRAITVEICFMYIRQKKVEVETPVYIDNICVYDARATGETTDLAISIVEGLETDSAGHYSGLDIQLGDDGIYYYTYTNNTGKTERVMLYADVKGITYWTERHLSDRFFQKTEQVMQGNEWVDQTTSLNASLYNVCFWYWDSSLIYENKDYTDVLYDAYYMQGICESTVDLVPVTESFREMLYYFTKQAYKSDYKLGPDKEYTITPLEFTDEWYEDQWLEFCYYFLHFGPEHANPDDCYRHYNPIKGIIFDTAYELELGDTQIVISSPVSLTYNEIEAGGGVKYKFTPEESGIYLFTSSHNSSDESVDDNGNYTGVDPTIYIFDLDRRVEIAYNNDDARSFVAGYSPDFYVYVELKAGVTYGITATVNYVLGVNPNKPDKYTMSVSKCEEDSIGMLRTAAYSNTESWYIDAEGNPTKPDGSPSEDGTVYWYYSAVKTALNPDTRYYHEYLEGGEFGSVIYINFVDPNYLNDNGYSLYDFMYAVYYVLDEDGNRVLDENGEEILERSYPLGKDLTEKLEVYYLKSIEGKDESDELYGYIEADEALVKLIIEMLATQNPEINVERAWERCAAYYVYYNTPVD